MDTNFDETKPIRIDRLKVVGLKRTKDDIVIKATKCLFNSKTLGDAISNINEAKANLARLNCFSEINVKLDVNSINDQESFLVQFDIKETNWIQATIKFASDVSYEFNNNPKISSNFSLTNLFCRGEKLDMSTDLYSAKKFSTGSITFSKPLIAPLKPNFHASIFKNYLNKSKFGFFQDEAGLSSGFNLEYNSLKLTLGWEGVMRTLGQSVSPPFGIREQLGLSLKSSLKMVSTYDTRNSEIFPLNGTLLQHIVEVAGLGGNHEFIKNEVLLQKNIRSFFATTITGSLSFGVLESNGKSNILDNFYLGGPLTFRGFDDYGIGKQYDGSVTGGTMYWRLNTHFHVPLPFLSEKNQLSHFIRMHVFMNSGNIGNRQGTLTNDIKSLLRNIRLSFGAGLAFHMNNMLRFELNYCLPVYYQNGDSIILNRCQWGFGFSYQ
ncbi:sorting and assembly machinery component 50 homolog B-like [Daktulosphaira vitifoliae]|uniref:sorting and assembly machinery component 50 homolog B-like n=1 Tax=Daktulosphaira vitifoliae TaxID=58002 RepID=UPI0021AA75B6|nr:sorting and assembly machinery component 50 homolog B-like [Daktulosphaira vitifoliae]